MMFGSELVSKLMRSFCELATSGILHGGPDVSAEIDALANRVDLQRLLKIIISDPQAEPVDSPDKLQGPHETPDELFGAMWEFR